MLGKHFPVPSPLTFLTPYPLSNSPCHPHLSFSYKSIHTGNRIKPRVRKRLRPVQCGLGEPEVPPSMAYLDMLEFQRRQSRPQSQPLDDKVNQALFAKIPGLKELDEKLERSMQEDDYDPNDHRVYTWAYNKLRPVRPSILAMLSIPAIFSYLIFRLSRFLYAKISPATLARYLVLFDHNVTLIFAFSIPLLLLTWALRTARPKRNRQDPAITDGLRRTTILYALALPLFPTVWAMTATSNLRLALVTSLFFRATILKTLWLWRDLRREIFLSRTRIAPYFRVWRYFFTTFILIFGSAIRFAALRFSHVIDIGAAMEQRATALRLFLGKRFPVSFSLCNDPRALFLLSTIVTAALVIYWVFLFVFPTDFLRKVDHRDCETPLTLLFTSHKLYQPNVHPNDLLGRLTAPHPLDSMLPSPAMLLRHDDNIQTESMLTSDGIMPILAYLDKEQDLQDQEGITEWLKPRGEQVPLTKTLTREKRSMDALLSWARPMDDAEADLSFAEFFQTLEDEDFKYDKDSGNWVFEESGLLGDYDFNKEGAEEQTGQQEISNGNAGNGAIAEADADADAEPRIVVRETEDGGAEVEFSPELEPWLQRYLANETLDGADDDADGSAPIYT